MNDQSELEINLSTKNLPFEYKFLEWRLIINRELYDAKIIDLKTFSLMENSLITRMTKIKSYLFKTNSR